jgi:hypothetical protein
MLQLTPEIERAFEQRLDQAHVPPALRPGYRKWLQFYLLFCERFHYSPRTPTSLGPFLTRLAARNQSIEQRRLAAAIGLFLRPDPQPPVQTPSPSQRAAAPTPGRSLEPPCSSPGRGTSWQKEYRDLEGAIKLRNYSNKTFEAYRFWVSKFQAFVRSRPTSEIGTPEVRSFLHAGEGCETLMDADGR